MHATGQVPDPPHPACPAAPAWRRLPLLLGVLAALLVDGPAQAQTSIVRDGSLGAGPAGPLGASGVVARNGSLYNRLAIPESAGLRVGTNVFHSFSTFRVGSGDAAVFTLGAPTRNVVARVTGGTPTTVQGLLMLAPGASGGAPDVFLVNPAGITFGAGAIVDVPAAFHAGTADQVRLRDGIVHADPRQASTFTSADPVAFGFLPANQGRLVVREQARIATSGPSVSLVAAAIAITGGTVQAQGGGAILLAATGPGPAEVPLAGDLPPLAGSLQVADDGSVSTVGSALGAAGSIRVQAGSLRIDGGDATASSTGIASRAGAGGGPAGAVQVDVAGGVELLRGGTIASETSSSGPAGSVQVKAGSLRIDGGSDAGRFTGISARAHPGSSGNAGSVQVTAAGELRLQRGGQIGASTHGAGAAGSVAIQAGDMVADGTGASTATGVASDAAGGGTGRAGTVQVQVVRSLGLRRGGTLSASTQAAGDAGSVVVQAGEMLVDGTSSALLFTGVASTSEAGASGNAGTVRVDVAGPLVQVGGGQVTAGTRTAGHAGSVAVTAATIRLDGEATPRATGILADAGEGSSGRGGEVRVATRALAASGRAQVSADARGAGHGGSVTLEAGSVHLAAGSVVGARTFGPGHAGSTRVTAGEVLADGGAAGTVTGISGEAQEGSRGDAGSVEVAVQGSLTLRDGGMVSASTYGSGNGGSVVVRAARVALGRPGADAAAVIASQVARGGTGSAGDIRVTATDEVVLLGGGSVVSSTFGAGTAGSVEVSAPRIAIDGQGSDHVSGILSQAKPGSVGNAGSVRVQAADRLSVANDGRISSSTFARGDGGSVAIEAGTLQLAGGGFVAAQAGPESGGQTGNVTITATRSVTMADRARITIQNDATVEDAARLRTTTLRLATPELQVQGSSITAAASGNVAASAVDVTASGTLRLVSSRISTASNNGDGGPLHVDGGALLDLRDSQVSTSVAGLQGNGGDIRVRAGTILLRTAFIQANTAAADAAGGNVRIDTQALIPSGSSLAVGGTAAPVFVPGAFGFNLVQAAAPTGLSGTVDITSPVLDLAGALAGLNVRRIEPAGWAGSPCQAAAGSSLVRAGRGALPASQRGLLGPDGPAGAAAATQAQHGGAAASRIGCGLH